MAKTWEWDDDDDEKHQHAMIARLGWRGRASPSLRLSESSPAHLQTYKKSGRAKKVLPLSLPPESPPGICATVSAGQIGGERRLADLACLGHFAQIDSSVLRFLWRLQL